MRVRVRVRVTMTLTPTLQAIRDPRKFEREKLGKIMDTILHKWVNQTVDEDDLAIALEMSGGSRIPFSHRMAPNTSSRWSRR
jgi:hypothetical protein